MAVRNFYATIENDRGRAPCGTGPQGKDEGFWITIKQRDRGGIIEALTIRGHVTPTGELELLVKSADNNVVHIVTTER